MYYIQEQKELLLDKLFDGVVCFDIYRNVNIRHRNGYLSHYRLKSNRFLLNWKQIWNFFENKNRDNFLEIRELTSSILIDLTKQKKLTTYYSVGRLKKYEIHTTTERTTT